MRLTVVVFSMVLIACLAGCDSSEKRAEARQAALKGDADPSTIDRLKADTSVTREFDEDAARDAARDSLTGQSYDDSEGSANCSDDCSGHNAGWQHAQEEGESDCDNDGSDSYQEGCLAYGEAIQRKVDAARDAFDRGDDAFLKRD